MINIYAPELQPATGWIDTHSGEPMHFGFPPEALIYTNCCTKRRMAKHCFVQCCYDGLNIFCAPGHGCKDQAEICAKKAREFANRSAAQRARWSRNRNKTGEATNDGAYNHVPVKPKFFVRATYKHAGRLRPRLFPEEPQ